MSIILAVFGVLFFIMAMALFFNRADKTGNSAFMGCMFTVIAILMMLGSLIIVRHEFSVGLPSTALNVSSANLKNGEETFRVLYVGISKEYGVEYVDLLILEKQILDNSHLPTYHRFPRWQFTKNETIPLDATMLIVVSKDGLQYKELR